MVHAGTIGFKGVDDVYQSLPNCINACWYHTELKLITAGLP